MGSEYRKPLPRMPDYEKPFWQAVKNRELRLQRCLECGEFRYPISPVCPRCLSFRREWAKLSGRGKVSSWILYRQAFHSGWQRELPYNVAWIELEEGPCLTTNLVGVDQEEISIGMPVEIVFEDVAEEVTLIKFRPSLRAPSSSAVGPKTTAP